MSASDANKTWFRATPEVLQAMLGADYHGHQNDRPWLATFHEYRCVINGMGPDRFYLLGGTAPHREASQQTAVEQIRLFKNLYPVLTLLGDAHGAPQPTEALALAYAEERGWALWNQLKAQYTSWGRTLSIGVRNTLIERIHAGSYPANQPTDAHSLFAPRAVNS